MVQGLIFDRFILNKSNVFLEISLFLFLIFLCYKICREPQLVIGSNAINKLRIKTPSLILESNIKTSKTVRKTIQKCSLQIKKIQNYQSSAEIKKKMFSKIWNCSWFSWLEEFLLPKMLCAPNCCDENKIRKLRNQPTSFQLLHRKIIFYWNSLRRKCLLLHHSQSTSNE